MCKTAVSEDGWLIYFASSHLAGPFVGYNPDCGDNWDPLRINAYVIKACKILNLTLKRFHNHVVVSKRI